MPNPELTPSPENPTVRSGDSALDYIYSQEMLDYMDAIKSVDLKAKTISHSHLYQSDTDRIATYYQYHNDESDETRKQFHLLWQNQDGEEKLWSFPDDMSETSDDFQRLIRKLLQDADASKMTPHLIDFLNQVDLSSGPDFATLVDQYLAGDDVLRLHHAHVLADYRQEFGTERERELSTQSYLWDEMWRRARLPGHQPYDMPSATPEHQFLQETSFDAITSPDELRNRLQDRNCDHIDMYQLSKFYEETPEAYEIVKNSDIAGSANPFDRNFYTVDDTRGEDYLWQLTHAIQEKKFDPTRFSNDIAGGINYYELDGKYYIQSGRHRNAALLALGADHWPANVIHLRPRASTASS